MFTQFLGEYNLIDKPISQISVRHIQLFLNSFCSGEKVPTDFATLKKLLPDSVCGRELIREGIINANSLYRLKSLGSSIKIQTAKGICSFYHLRFDEYFEQVYKVKEYSAETIKGHRRILRTLFNEAVRYDWIAKNPVCKTKIGAKTGNANVSVKPVEEKEVFSIAEVKQFIKLLDELPEDMIYRRVPLKFMVLTGVRTAELHGLRWSDIDLDKKVVHIKDCAREWNNNRKTGDRFIHPDEIREFLQKDSTVFKYKYRNKWIVNYDQLLPHLQKMNRRESKKWKEYMARLGIKNSVTPRKK